MLIIKFLIDFLYIRNSLRLVLIVSGMVLMAILEVAAVGSIAPFMSVLTETNILEQSDNYISKIYSFLDFENKRSFIYFMGFSCISLLFVSNIYIVFFTWQLNHWCRLQGHFIAEGLLIKYLNQDYKNIIQRNSSDLSKNVLIEADRFVDLILFPYMTFLSRSVVVLFLSTILLIIYKAYFIFAVSTLLLVYLLISYLLKYQHSVIGKKTSDRIQQRYKAAFESVQSIKELKIFRSENVFLKRFSKPSKELAFYTALGKTIVMMPKYFIEIVAFSTFIISFIFISNTGNSIGDILPELSIITLAAYRILPAMQMAYEGKSNADIHFKSLKYLKEEIRFDFDINAKLKKHNFSFEEMIKVENLSFKYENTNDYILNDISFSINKGQKIGIVGSTGSGKTTLVDLISGLLKPSSGNIFIDKNILNLENDHLWLENISYVSQAPFFYDDTISNNISMKQSNEGNIDRIKSAAKSALIDKFINDLPEKYNTIIGDKGVKISGGQRQRIAIARALYKNSDVFFLDEPTSALNIEVESELMESLYKLKSHTLIIIAHRLSTLEMCDKIIEIRKGKISFSGSFKSYKKYKKLIN